MNQYKIASIITVILISTVILIPLTIDKNTHYQATEIDMSVGSGEAVKLVSTKNVVNYSELTPREKTMFKETVRYDFATFTYQSISTPNLNTTEGVQYSGIVYPIHSVEYEAIHKVTEFGAYYILFTIFVSCETILFVLIRKKLK